MFKHGDVVRYRDPQPTEVGQQFLLVEWNGDRGFGMDLSLISWTVPPTTLLRGVEIELVPQEEQRRVS